MAIGAGWIQSLHRPQPQSSEAGTWLPHGIAWLRERRQRFISGFSLVGIAILCCDPAGILIGYGCGLLVFGDTGWMT